MSNFDNMGLGDGGLQKSREKQGSRADWEKEQAKFNIQQWQLDKQYRNDAAPRETYKHLTHEKLKNIIDDLMFKFTPEEEQSIKEFEAAHPLVDAPDGWEENRRAELRASLPDGLYELGPPGGPIQGWTGKGGHIDFRIAMEKYAKRYK